MSGWAELELDCLYGAGKREVGLGSVHGALVARANGVAAAGPSSQEDTMLDPAHRAARRRVLLARRAVLALPQPLHHVLDQVFVLEPVPAQVHRVFGRLGRLATTTVEFRDAGAAWARDELRDLRSSKAKARAGGMRIGACLDDDGVVYVEGMASSVEGCPECERPMVGEQECPRDACIIACDDAWVSRPRLSTYILTSMCAANAAKTLTEAHTRIRRAAARLAVAALDAYVQARYTTDPGSRYDPHCQEQAYDLGKDALQEPRHQEVPQPGLRRRPPRTRMPGES